MVELLLEEARAEERKIKNELDEDALVRLRPRLLSIFWALIKAWHQKGEPKSSKVLPTFEAWSNVVAAIVKSAGFSSPCQLATLSTGGDTDTQDMEKLVNKMPPEKEFKFPELVSLAHDNELFPRLIPSEGEPERNQSTRLGMLIRKFVGRTFSGRYRFCKSGVTRRTERYYVTELKC